MVMETLHKLETQEELRDILFFSTDDIVEFCFGFKFKFSSIPAHLLPPHPHGRPSPSQSLPFLDLLPKIPTTPRSLFHSTKKSLPTKIPPLFSFISSPILI